METFRIVFDSQENPYQISVEEAVEVNADLVRVLMEIDLQTFSESTFSTYTAAAFLQSGRVFLLKAEDIVIGTCVSMRCFDRPNEAMILSMGIRPGWRGRGLGQNFLAQVMRALGQGGVHSVCLYVGAENRRALKVYRDVGFRLVAQAAVDPYSRGELVLMRAQLKDADVIPLPH